MRIRLLAAAVLVTASAAQAGDPIAPISERYSAIDTVEKDGSQPDFRRHVVPLLGKVGCNGRACHGSFQGQGGFRLSLFGYDFKLDHEQLTQGDNPRVDTDVVDESLILEKATLAIPHKGGKRFEPDSWHHNVLRAWVKAGAKGLEKANKDGEPDESVVLEITPNDIQFAKADESVQLKILARWSNGDVEDVTPLCRFQTNNEQIAKVDEKGTITAADPGDTHVVVFYDNAVVPIPVMRPVSDSVGDKYPNTPAPTEVDRLVLEKLKRLGIVQSDLCTDGEFLRRVSLDMTGSLPSPKEIETFVADTSSDKRQKKIDELLERPTYAAWWSTKLCDITGNNDAFLNNVGLRNGISQHWYSWINKRVADNVPYDKLVEGIVLANSRNEGESYEDYCKEMSALYHKDSDASFADQDGLVYFWARRNFRTPNERALGFAYTFLGIRIQCAECHKHPFDQWTQDDYKQFTGFFGRVQFGRSPEGRDKYTEMLAALNVEQKQRNGNDIRRELLRKVEGGAVVPFDELFVTPARAAPNRRNNRPNRGQATAATAKLLGSDKVDVGSMDDPRKALMGWLRDSNNPFFAKAFVNRVWASYFNVGIVQPADDLSLANPPSNKALLDHLAKGFIESGFDMKWVHREIANSRTYQLSWQTNDTNALDDRNFSHAVPRRMPAEVAVDIVQQATASDADFELFNHDVSKRAIAIPSTGRYAGAPRGQDATFALTVFGRSTRESNCDCDRSSEASLLQTIYLKNDNDVLAAIERRGGWVDQVLKASGTPNSKATQEEKEKPKRPADYEARVAQMKKLVKRLRDKKDEKLEKAEARLADYIQQYAQKESPVSASDTANGETEKVEPKFNTAEVVRSAYLRTLSREPTPGEQERSTRFIYEATSPDEGVRGLLWALLNTKEFIVNH